MNIAIIIAGGVGSRALQDVPKQFLCVDDKPIIIHTLEKFQRNKNIDKIIVVSLVGWEKMVESFCKQFNISKLSEVVIAGENRFLSMYSGVKALKNSANLNDIVLIYDANRPMINDEIIDDSILKAKDYDGVISVLPCYDSMFISKDGNVLEQSIDRKFLYRGMGLESAHFEKVVEVFEEYNKKQIYNYNLSEMLKNNGYKVGFSKSSPKCIKITTIEDLEMFMALYENKEYKRLKHGD